MSVVYTNNFTGTNGAAWADFVTSEAVTTGGAIDIQSNKGRMLTVATAYHTLRAILPSGNWNSIDGEVLFPTDIEGAVGQQIAVLRGSGAWSVTEEDAPTNGYFAFMNMAGHTVEIFKSVSSVITSLASLTLDYGFVAATFWTRFRVEGDALTLTVWDAAGGEPGSPTLTTTGGGAVTGAGQFMMSYHTVDAVARSITMDSLTLNDLAVGGQPTGKRLGGVPFAAAGQRGRW